MGCSESNAAYEITRIPPIDMVKLQEALNDKKKGSQDNINYKGQNGCSALMNAAHAGSTEAVALLLQHGADVHATDNYFGSTALHQAANMTDGANPYCVDLLLKAGAEVNAVDTDYGRTALHCAAGNGQPLVVHVLLKAGADRMAKNNNGNTPLDLANAYKHDRWKECVELLEGPTRQEQKNKHHKDGIQQEEEVEHGSDAAGRKERIAKLKQQLAEAKEEKRRKASTSPF